MPYTKINLKCIKDFKTPSRKHRGKLHDINFENDFLDMSLKSQGTAAKIDK